MAKTSKSVTAADFDAAVFTYYMRNGDAATITEIAEELGCSTRAVHKVLNSNTCRSVCKDKRVAVHSKSTGTIVGHKNVDAYFPGSRDLRQRLLHYVKPDDAVPVNADWLSKFCAVIEQPDCYTEYRCHFLLFSCEQGVWNAYAFACHPWQHLRSVLTRGDVRELFRGLSLLLVIPGEKNASIPST
jgi:hypothetical protein